jgi:predicted Zn-dependent protease
LFRQNRSAESLRVLQRALALAPSAVEVRFELARVFYHADRPEELARVLQPALVSDECRVHNLLALIYSAQGNANAANIEIEAMKDCHPRPFR